MQGQVSFGRRGMAPAPAALPKVAPAPARRERPERSEALSEARPLVADALPDEDRAFGRIPWASLAIAVVLLLVFLAELADAPGAGTASISPATALHFGAVSRDLVFHDGQVWRLLTAQWLHWGVGHIIGNTVVLILIGLLLEPIIGWRWLTAVFALGGVGGALASILLNDQNVTSVGASGAIMAVLGCAAAVSLHPAAVGRRVKIWRRCLFSGVPALLPAAHSHVDYSAHAGGALAGFAAGYFLLMAWNGQRQRPPFQDAAMVAAAFVGLAGLTALGMAAALPPAKIAYRGTAGLIPPDQIPVLTDDGLQKAADLVAAYPNDPRGHALMAMLWDKRGGTGEAELELQKALSSPLLHARELPDDLDHAPARLDAVHRARRDDRVVHEPEPAHRSPAGTIHGQPDRVEIVGLVPHVDHVADHVGVRDGLRGIIVAANELQRVLAHARVLQPVVIDLISLGAALDQVATRRVVNVRVAQREGGARVHVGIA